MKDLNTKKYLISDDCRINVDLSNIKNIMFDVNDEFNNYFDNRKLIEEKEEQKKRCLYKKAYLFGDNISEENIKMLSFDNLIINDFNMSAFKALQEWNDEKKGIMLTGSTGTGKTTLLKALAIKWVSRDCSICFMTAKGILDVLDDKLIDIHIMDRMFQKPEILIIDDFGAEKEGIREESQLFDIINKRYVYSKKLFISTNLSIEEIKNRYHQRLIDRVRAMVKLYQISGPSMRESC